jgi:hypothetical protein
MRGFREISIVAAMTSAMLVTTAGVSSGQSPTDEVEALSKKVIELYNAGNYLLLRCLSPRSRRWRIPGIRWLAAAIWIASRSPAINWWRRLPAGSTSRPATCSSVSRCSRVRTTIAMFVSGGAVVAARSALSSCRTCSDVVTLLRFDCECQIA